MPGIDFSGLDLHSRRERNSIMSMNKMTKSSAGRQALAVTLAAILLCFNSACAVNKIKKVDAASVPQPERAHIVGVTTKKGEDVRFDQPGGTVDQGVIRAKVKGAPYSIAMQDAQRLWIEQIGTS